MLWRSPLCRRLLLPPTRPLLTRLLHPLLRPLLLDKPCSWINSNCSCLQPSSAFQWGTGMERSFLNCSSWVDGRAVAYIPAPAALWSHQDQVQNTQDLEVLITNVGSLFCAGQRNLVIWELWVCLWAGISYEMGLEMFMVALIPALLTSCPFSARYVEKGELAHLLSSTTSISPKKSLLKHRRVGTPIDEISTCGCWGCLLFVICGAF